LPQVRDDDAELEPWPVFGRPYGLAGRRDGPRWDSLSCRLRLLARDLGSVLKPEDVAAIKKGETTEAQVVTLLGVPDEIHQVGNREVFHYYHYARKHTTLLVFSRVNIASDQVFVLFDDHGLVDEVISGNRTDKLEFQFWPFGG
jgi:outer membrane protein assembly factor BamE (lipoprotein component of BamABCDE complex)